MLISWGGERSARLISPDGSFWFFTWKTNRENLKMEQFLSVKYKKIQSQRWTGKNANPGSGDERSLGKERAVGWTGKVLHLVPADGIPVTDWNL